MNRAFFERPILNSPYSYPGRHWELDDSGQPTDRIMEQRRRAEFVTPIPPSQKQKRTKQQELGFTDAAGLSTDEQRYNQNRIINELRRAVDEWRTIPDASKWRVTPETQRLLQHWRQHEFQLIRP